MRAAYLKRDYTVGQSALNILKEKALLKKLIFACCLLDSLRAKRINEVKRFFFLEKILFLPIGIGFRDF